MHIHIHSQSYSAFVERNFSQRHVEPGGIHIHLLLFGLVPCLGKEKGPGCQKRRLGSLKKIAAIARMAAIRKMITFP